jgi:RND family efflux transporter MFP subunit
MKQITALLIMMSAALAGCSAPQAADAPADAAEPFVVRVGRASMTDVATAIDAGGVVQARTTATITSRILAPVRDVLVLPGDRVRKGQTLIVLDGDDLTAAARAARSAILAAEQGSKAAAGELQAAEASLVLARASHDRIAELQSKRAATAQELDDAIATLRGAEGRIAAESARVSQAASAVEGARAASDRANSTESFAALVAPFDGIVTEKMIEPGNMASPGLPLLRLEDTREFRLEVHVDESRLGHVRTGDCVPVRLGAGTSERTGTIVEVSRAVDADARAFLVKIALPDTRGVRSGEFRPSAIQRIATACVDHSIVGNRAARTTHVCLCSRRGTGARATSQPERGRSTRGPGGIRDGDSVAAGRAQRWSPGPRRREVDDRRIRRRRPDGRGIHQL